MSSLAITDQPLPGMESLGLESQDFASPLLPITDAARRRFWGRTTVTECGCWVWAGAVASDGYGRITWTHHGVARTLSTHRFALHLAFGPSLPVDRVAAHECDNPLCVRVGPAHVHLSTQSENLRHAVQMGRHEGTIPVVGSEHRRSQALAFRNRLTGSKEPPSILNAPRLF